MAIVCDVCSKQPADLYGFWIGTAIRHLREHRDCHDIFERKADLCADCQEKVKQAILVALGPVTGGVLTGERVG